MKQLKVMEDHTEQHFEKLAKKVMKTSLLESPSLEFTANVMAGVKADVVNDITVYKPLISKRWWFIISVLFIGGLIYSLMGTDMESTGWLGQIDFSVISNNKVTEALSGITISKTLAYAIGFFGLVFFIQIPMMKHYFDNRMAL